MNPSVGRILWEWDIFPSCIRMVLLAVLAAIITLIYKRLVRNYDYWEKRGIRGPIPLPLFGTTLNILTKGLIKADADDIAQFGKVFGQYEGRWPALLVADVRLLKDVFVKEFSSFTNRKGTGVKEYPLRSSITRIENEHWKRVRSVLSPAFSSCKLKAMIPEMNKCASNMVDHMREKANVGANIEIKEYSGAYTMDVIASTAFGIALDSQSDRDNPFVMHAKDLFNVKLTNPLIVTILLFPFAFPLLQRLGFRVTKKEIVDFFSGIVDETIEERQSEAFHNYRVDFLQLMIKAQEDSGDAEEENGEYSVTSGTNENGKAGRDKERKKILSHEEVIAQSLSFFLAGYETTATTISFLLYSLAINSDVQEELFNEIRQNISSEDEIDYNILSKMPYLDMCVSETLRLYPPAVRTNRMCQRDVKVGDYLIQRGVSVNIPIYSIHRDAETWPDPDAFKPERFTPENKATRHPLSFIPFGFGPRGCIGMRLALIEMKIAVIHILMSFRAVCSDRTQRKIIFKKTTILTPEIPIIFRIEPR